MVTEMEESVAVTIDLTSCMVHNILRGNDGCSVVVMTLENGGLSEFERNGGVKVSNRIVD